MNRKVKLFINLIFSLLSSAIPLIFLQIYCLPLMAIKLGNEKYGVSITIYSILTIIASSGNALNNVRLINNETYKKNNIMGDYNLLLLITEIVGSIVGIIFTSYYIGCFFSIHSIFMVMISVLMIGRAYLIVGYCIELNYFKIFVNNLILTVGYFLGNIFFQKTGYWELVYVIGNFFGIVHLYFTTNLLKEGIGVTKLFKNSLYQYSICIVSTVLANMLNYIDKILIYPILGGTAVSIYYVATLIGKIILMAISPINSVLLSYMAKLSYLKKKSFYISTIISIILGSIGYFICIWISGPILEILYPSLVEQALQYIKIATLTAIITAYISLLSPLLLKFCHINWQIIISLISIITYVIIAFSLSKVFGLYGFAMGSLIANTIKLLMMCSIYIISNRKKKN